MCTIGEVKRDDSKRRKRIITINEDTGEYNEKRLIVDRLFSSKGYVIKYNNDYIKMFLDESLPKECTLNDCGKFYRLTRYIVGNNQLLGYRGTNGFKPLTTDKISIICDSSERQTKTYLRKMKKLGVIKDVVIDNEKWYAVNPLYALKGKYLTFSTFITFMDELKAKLPEWVIKEFMIRN